MAGMLPPRLGAAVVDSATISRYGCVVNNSGGGRRAAPRKEPHPMATFAIDPAHTDVLFSAKHMMVTTVRGTFNDVRGTHRARRGRSDRARSAEFVLPAASLDTGFGARDNHLRSADFFAAETYPEIRVVSTAIRPKRGQRLRRDRRRHDPRRHAVGRLRCRVPRLLHRHGRRPPGRVQRPGQGQPQGLGPRLERRPRGRRLAGRRPDQARGRGRAPGGLAKAA